MPKLPITQVRADAQKQHETPKVVVRPITTKEIVDTRDELTKNGFNVAGESSSAKSTKRNKSK